jgi:hypothetical protein
MSHVIDLAAFVAELPNQDDRRRLQLACDQHMRNGFGFWPMVRLADGATQVIRFKSAPASRWTRETGAVESVPLHALSPADWPRVQGGDLGR